MRKRGKLFGVLFMAASLIIMTLPVAEADAATSASGFVIEGSTLVKYRGTDTDVSIPDTVEIIGESAFENNTYVERVVIPDSVQEIEPYAFWGCDNLETVILGKGLSEVGDYAFAGCKGLKQMSIPVTVTSIGIQAFGDCVNMTDITIPAETLYIHETAFDGCARLTIHCDAGTAADTFAQAFYEKQKETAEYEDVPDYDSDYRPEEAGQDDGGRDEAEAVTEPEESARESEEDAGDGTVLGSTSVVGNRAVLFLDSSGLDVVETTPETSGEGGISSQAADILESMLSAGTVESIPKYTVVDGRIVADQAFYRSTSLGEVSLPDGIVEIGQFSFARSTITGIVVPEGVTDIGYGAFYHCDNLAAVELPDTVMNVEPRAFDYTAWVENFRSGGEDFLISGGVLAAYAGDSAEVVVPDGVRVIAAEVFAGHEEIESVILPDSVLVVGEAAFEGCTGLRQVNLGAGVEQIKDRAFSGCSSLETLNIPASVETVGLQALGEAEVTYEGNLPEQTYETSAARLSNESYRGLGEETSEPGVAVTGVSPSAAYLEGAARSYTLAVNLLEESSALEAAWSRIMESDLPDSIAVYELQLTDSSGIPLSRLGYSGLTVVLPVPDTLAGQELKMVTLDRNGQLEALGAERVSLDGTECFCFRTTHLSVFAVYGTGTAGEETVLREISVDLSGMSAASEGGETNVGTVRLLVGIAMLLTGLMLFVSGRRGKR